MTSQSSDDPDDVTLGEEDQEELRDTLTGHGLAPTAQDPDEDEAYTPTQDDAKLTHTVAEGRYTTVPYLFPATRTIDDGGVDISFRWRFNAHWLFYC